MVEGNNGFLDDIYPDRKLVLEIVEQLESDKDRIGRLKNGDTYVIDLSKPELQGIYNRTGKNFLELCKEALIKIIQERNPGTFVEETHKKIRVSLTGEHMILLHNLSPEYEGKPATFNCNITTIDNRHTYIKRCMAQCPLCCAEEKVECDEERKIRMPLCSERSCKKAQMEIKPSTIVTEYIQNIILEEPLDEANEGQPVSFVGVIVGQHIGEVKPGDRKKVTGVFTTVINPKKVQQDININVLDVQTRDSEDIILPSEEELVKLKEDVKKPDFLDNMINSFAPHIYGLKDIKKTILMQLAGGTESETRRPDINILLCGDPSCGKTELLKFGKSVVQKSVYTSGKGASGAGLTITMVKHEQIGTWMAQAGVYPLCNGGHVFVDEFDKMSREDRSSMHEVMEQGTCSKAKAGVVLTLDARATTTAAANPRFGKYKSELNLLDNIDLPVPLLSRFDIIWLMKDVVDSISDSRKAKHILSGYLKDQKKPCYSQQQIMSYINYIKKLKPVLTEDVNYKLEKMYNELRDKSKAFETVPVGTRQLESMVRLCTAHAKLHMRDEVTDDDVLEIFRIFKMAYESLGLDIETGGSVQAQFVSTAMNKDEAFENTIRIMGENNIIKEDKLVEELLKLKQFKTKNDIYRHIGRYDSINRLLKKGNDKWELV